jgi:hypothetical protein|tara:strand:+ start:481 stop:633 length:153 start_codon:yes stop_codon:yes gene_type:complete
MRKYKEKLIRNLFMKLINELMFLDVLEFKTQDLQSLLRVRQSILDKIKDK